MNQKQKEIFLLIENRLGIKLDEKLISNLINGSRYFYSLPRAGKKTISVVATAIIIAVTSKNKTINIYYASNPKRCLNERCKVLIEALKTYNCTFIENNLFAIITFENGSTIKINKRIDHYSYVSKCDYAFIDELHSIDKNTKRNLEYILMQSNHVSIVTTLPLHCRKILKLFYKYNFEFEFIKRSLEDVPDECSFGMPKEILQIEVLGTVIP